MDEHDDLPDLGPLARLLGAFLEGVLVSQKEATSYWGYAKAAALQLERLKNTQHLRDDPVEFMATVNFLHMSALQMARRVVRDRIPPGITAQTFLYNEKASHLRMWMSSSVQSVSSTEPWPLTREPERRQQDIGSDGICVRAFAAGEIQVKVGTRDDPIVVRAGEPIAAIISSHVTPRPAAQHNDIASLNVTCRRRNFFPRKLNDMQLMRLNYAREFLAHVNGMYRLLEIRFR